MFRVLYISGRQPGCSDHILPAFLVIGGHRPRFLIIQICTSVSAAGMPLRASCFDLPFPVPARIFQGGITSRYPADRFPTSHIPPSRRPLAQERPAKNPNHYLQPLRSNLLVSGQVSTSCRTVGTPCEKVSFRFSSSIATIGGSFPGYTCFGNTSWPGRDSPRHEHETTVSTAYKRRRSAGGRMPHPRIKGSGQA